MDKLWKGDLDRRQVLEGIGLGSIALFLLLEKGCAPKKEPSGRYVNLHEVLRNSEPAGLDELGIPEIKTIYEKYESLFTADTRELITDCIRIFPALDEQSAIKNVPKISKLAVRWAKPERINGELAYDDNAYILLLNKQVALAELRAIIVHEGFHALVYENRIGVEGDEEETECLGQYILYLMRWIMNQEGMENPNREYHDLIHGYDSMAIAFRLEQEDLSPFKQRGSRIFRYIWDYGVAREYRILRDRYGWELDQRRQQSQEAMPPLLTLVPSTDPLTDEELELRIRQCRERIEEIEQQWTKYMITPGWNDKEKQVLEDMKQRKEVKPDFFELQSPVKA